MTNTKRAILVVAGGLGNQLFEFAAALHLAGKRTLEIDPRTLYPRLNHLKLIELQSFQLPENVIIHQYQKPNWLAHKTASFFMRLSASKKKFKHLSIYKFIQFLGSLILSVNYKTCISLVVAEGLGECDLEIPDHNFALIGLFQSFKWSTNTAVLEQLKGLRVAQASTELENLTKLAETEKPLVVHIRLGDYLLEQDFGIPSTSYYSEAIEYCMANGEFNSIWLFSNDMQGARKILPGGIDLPIREIVNVGDSSAEVLQAMRLGFGYVIANSTFSWWGAFLTNNGNALVCYPSPWFESTHSPQGLTPIEWISFDAFNRNLDREG